VTGDARPGAAEFARAVSRLVNQVSHWTPPRWAASSASGGTRAEVVHALVQRIADLAADAEGQPRRPVPRLDSDLALPDQLRVVAADLLAAGSTADLGPAAELVAAARQAL
jgi:hypothetical protein